MDEIRKLVAALMVIVFATTTGLGAEPAHKAYFSALALKCESKTEHGFGPFGDSDEVAMLWWQKDSKQEVRETIPGRDQYWEYEEGQTSAHHPLLNLSGMYSAGPDHATEFIIALVERDHKENPALDALRKAIRERHVPPSAEHEESVDLIAGVGKALLSIGAAIASNKDDILGVIEVRVEKNASGRLKATWSAGDYATLKSTKGNAAKFSLEHDGARYELDITIVEE